VAAEFQFGVGPPPMRIVTFGYDGLHEQGHQIDAEDALVRVPPLATAPVLADAVPPLNDDC